MLNQIQLPQIKGVEDTKLLINYGIAFVENMFARQEFIEALICHPDDCTAPNAWAEN